MASKEKRLHIGGLFSGVTEEDLRHRFRNYGNITSVDIITRQDSHGQCYKTFAYINITLKEDDLNKCIQTYNGSKWKGYTMRLQIAKQSFLDRLKSEREDDQRKKDCTPQEKINENLHLEVENLVLKGRKPGDAVEGKEDWVVGKFGRVLPVVNIRRKDKAKVIKVDPSKFVHNLKKLEKEGDNIQVSKSEVTSLTWALDESKNNEYKKRVGDFSDYSPVKKRKVYQDTVTSSDRNRDLGVVSFESTEFETVGSRLVNKPIYNSDSSDEDSQTESSIKVRNSSLPDLIKSTVPRKASHPEPDSSDSDFHDDIPKLTVVSGNNINADIDLRKKGENKSINRLPSVYDSGSESDTPMASLKKKVPRPALSPKKADLETHQNKYPMTKDSEISAARDVVTDKSLVEKDTDGDSLKKNTVNTASKDNKVDRKTKTCNVRHKEVMINAAASAVPRGRLPEFRGTGMLDPDEVPEKNLATKQEKKFQDVQYGGDILSELFASEESSDSSEEEPDYEAIDRVFEEKNKLLANKSLPLSESDTESVDPNIGLPFKDIQFKYMDLNGDNENNSEMEDICGSDDSSEAADNTKSETSCSSEDDESNTSNSLVNDHENHSETNSTSDDGEDTSDAEENTPESKHSSESESEIDDGTAHGKTKLDHFDTSNSVKPMDKSTIEYKSAIDKSTSGARDENTSQSSILTGDSPRTEVHLKSKASNITRNTESNLLLNEYASGTTGITEQNSSVLWDNGSSDEEDLLDLVSSGNMAKVKKYETNAKAGKSTKSIPDKTKGKIETPSIIRDSVENSSTTNTTTTVKKVKTKKTGKIQESRNIQDKRAADNEKRIESLRQRAEQAKNKKKIMINALASKEVSSKNKIVFDSDSDDEAAAVKPNTSSILNKTNREQQGDSMGNKATAGALFADEDDDDESDEDAQRFRIRPEYEGESGSRLLSMQRRFEDDDRFKLNERFVDRDEDNTDLSEKLAETEKNRKEVSGESENSIEKVKSLQILGEMFKNTTFKAKSTKYFKDMNVVHYDPTRKDHQQFEITPSAPDKPQGKKTKKKKEVVEEVKEDLPEVSREKFYEVDSSFRDLLSKKKENQDSVEEVEDSPSEKPFSLLALFGKAEDKSERNVIDGTTPIYEKPTMGQRREHFGGAGMNREDDDSDDGLNQSNVPMGTDKDSGNDTSKPNTSSRTSGLLIKNTDQRVQESIAWFQRGKDSRVIRERWAKRRPDLREAYRLRQKKTLRNLRKQQDSRQLKHKHKQR